MHFTPPVRVWRGPRVHDNDGNFEDFTVWGPTCDSYDVLPQIFTLPSDIDEDDWIEFGLMGAYTQASLTPFNGFDRRDQYWVDQILGAEERIIPRPNRRPRRVGASNLEEACMPLPIRPPHHGLRPIQRRQVDARRRARPRGSTCRSSISITCVICRNTDWEPRAACRIRRACTTPPSPARLGDGGQLLHADAAAARAGHRHRPARRQSLGQSRPLSSRRSWLKRNRAGHLRAASDSVKLDMVRWILVDSPRHLARYRRDLPQAGLPFIALASMRQLQRALPLLGPRKRPVTDSGMGPCRIISPKRHNTLRVAALFEPVSLQARVPRPIAALTHDASF